VTVRNLIDRLGAVLGTSDAYAVVGEVDAKSARILVAVSPRKNPALLVMGLASGPGPNFATRSLRVETVAQLEFVAGSTRDVAPAIVIEALDDALRDVFCALGDDLARELSLVAPATAKDVTALLRRWEALFAAAARLDESAVLGLWGELWALRTSSRPDALVAGWRGNDSGTFDFVVDDRLLEVKTTRVPGVHKFSHSQLREPDECGVLVSLVVEVGDQGTTLAEALDAVLARVVDPVVVRSSLKARGLTMASLRESTMRIVLTKKPAFYWLRDVPRVRLADAGVTQLRYSVDLLGTPPIAEASLQAVLDPFGLPA
jgi:hypothetical protein